MHINYKTDAADFETHIIEYVFLEDITRDLFLLLTDTIFWGNFTA